MQAMIRLLIGAVLGGLAQFAVGALMWATPLSRIAFSVADENSNAILQQALARTLTPTGTGTYYIPWPDTPMGTVLHGKGPVALIHYNVHGFPLMASQPLIVGLILSVVTMLLLGLALFSLGTRVTDFATRARIVALVSVATALYFTLSEPVFDFYLPWPWFIFSAVQQALGLIAGGLVVARWFLPRAGDAITR